MLALIPGLLSLCKSAVNLSKLGWLKIIACTGESGPLKTRQGIRDAGLVSPVGFSGAKKGKVHASLNAL